MLPIKLARLCETRAWLRLRTHLTAPLAACLLALSACGGGGGVIGGGGDDPPQAACTSATCGEVVIALADADGDFLSYSVDVVSIELEKANGAIVETLPTRQRVDFADLVDVTEFVTAATIPNGTYVGATVRLDYGDADVSVEVAGLPVETTVVDENGVPLDVVDLELQLDNANRVVVAPGLLALLQLDFDLAASHEVDITGVPAIATADPFLVATIEPLDAREFRVRGPLVSVDETAGSYVVDLRPFNHPNARLGRFRIETTADTTFEVDGEEFTGEAGLAAMEDLGVGAPTVAHGVYDVAAREFTADRVLAGDSVPGADFDVVIGNILARDGDELIVRGGTVIRRDDSVIFARGDILVQIGPNTVVKKDGGGGTTLTTDAISVGQRVNVFGDVTGIDPNIEMDATAGRVRMHLTHMTGTVVQANPGQIDLDLFSIDGRNPDFFDFSGTGSSIVADADPENYEVATGALDVSDFDPDDPARIFGFVTPFGAAPPDFEGRTLVNFDSIRALLGIGWGLAGTDAPFLSMGQDGFVIDTGNPDLGARHFIKVGPRIADITTLASPMTIEPMTNGRTLFALSFRGRLEMYRDFGDYATRVNSLLNGGSTMRALTARGAFDLDQVTLTANFVAISFRTP